MEMTILKPWKFTECQLQVLQAAKPGEPIKDIRTLKKLAILGAVKLHEHTGTVVKHIWGMLVRAWYIDEADMFEVEGVGIFRQMYSDGSIFPYLIKADFDGSGRMVLYNHR